MSTNNDSNKDSSPMADLMRAMGSKKGSDPIPPDQYLFFLEDKNPEQKALAYVRSKTIRHKYRSPYCVDEHGKPITLARLAADCGWDPGNASAYLTRLEGKGLIRTERGKEPGTSRETRIFLCGEVKPMSQQEEENKKRSQDISTKYLSDYQLNYFKKLAPHLQRQALNELDEVGSLQKRIDAAAIAASRAALSASWDSVYTKYGIPTMRKTGRPSQPRLCNVQIELFAQPAPSGTVDFIQTNGNFARKSSATSYEADQHFVHGVSDPVSLYRGSETEKDSTASSASSSSSFVAKPTTTTDTLPHPKNHPELHRDHDAIAEEVIERTALKLDPTLSEREQIRETLTSLKMTGINDWVISNLLSQTRAVAPDSTVKEITMSICRNWAKARKAKVNAPRYLISCVVEDFGRDELVQRRDRERQEAERDAAAMRRNAEQARDLAERTLRDPDADEQSKEWARASLGLTGKAKGAS